MARTLCLLEYHYVPVLLDRPGSYRDHHLATMARFRDEGTLLCAGTLGDPVDRALFIFAGREDAQRFMEQDPYITARIAVHHIVQPWTLSPAFVVDSEPDLQSPKPVG